MSEGLPSAVLGRTGLEVTRLGYGAMEIRGAPRGRQVTDGQAETILNAVLDAGIDFIDTSNDYGRSEELIGRYISHRRSEYRIATKCGCHPQEGHVWTKENLFRGLDESLERLKTEYVDIIQLHAGTLTVEECTQQGLVDALEEMRRQGRVRWIGISTRVPELPAFLELGVFDVFQIPYSALERDHEGLIAATARAGAGTIIRGGVAKGEPGVSGIDRSEVWRKFDEAKLDELLEEGEDHTAFMLRFTLTHPDVHTTIVGTLRPEHLEQNVRAVRQGPLAQNVYAEAKRRMDGAGVRPAEVS